MVIVFGSRAARPTCTSSRGEPSGRPRSTPHWRTWRGFLRCQRATRSIPRRWPRLFCTDTAPGRRLWLRIVVPIASNSRGARTPRAPPRGESADRLQSTHSVAQTSRGCVVGQRGARSLPRRRPGLNRINTATGRRHGVREVLITAFESHGVRCVRSSPRGKSADRPRSTRRAARIWNGCVVGQRGARSTPRQRPRLGRTNTATGRRHGVREALIAAFKSRGARRVRFTPREKSADRPRSTCRAARTSRGCAVGQRRARFSPRRRPGRDRINTATSRRRGPQEVFITAFEPRGGRHVRSSTRGNSAERPRSTPRAARTWRGCVVAQRWRAPPHVNGQALSALTP